MAPIPSDLTDRRVEITGPVDRKMIVNALNSGAKVFMADFEDASSPVFANMIEGQANLKDLWAGRIDFTDPTTGKLYAVKPERAGADGAPARLAPSRAACRHRRRGNVRRAVRLRPLCLSLRQGAEGGGRDARVLSPQDRKPSSRRGSGTTCSPSPRKRSAFPREAFKATVLIETLPAAFEMDEILYELRDHIVGLNCGRWDYIFSFIKRLGKNPTFLTPDRSAMTMGSAFLNAYSLLLIKTCHRRGAFAMGGMAAQIPIKGDPAANQAAFAKVRADKEREAGNGHDGTWVAHPDLVPVAMEVFDRLMPGPNQLLKFREDVQISAADLLQVHEGQRSEAGLRENIRVGVQYIEAWLRGRGAVPLYHLMEDAATAEISRAQVWQWLHLEAKLDDGRTVTPDLFRDTLADEMNKVRAAVGEQAFTSGRFDEAIALFSDMSLSAAFEEFLTLPAYRLID